MTIIRTATTASKWRCGTRRLAHQPGGDADGDGRRVAEGEGEGARVDEAGGDVGRDLEQVVDGEEDAAGGHEARLVEALREEEEGQDRPRRVGDRRADSRGDAHEDAVPGPGSIDRVRVVAVPDDEEQGQDEADAADRPAERQVADRRHEPGGEGDADESADERPGHEPQVPAPPVDGQGEDVGEAQEREDDADRRPRRQGLGHEGRREHAESGREAGLGEADQEDAEKREQSGHVQGPADPWSPAAAGAPRVDRV